MIADYEQRLDKLNEERDRLANLYAKNRKMYGKLKSELDVIYAASIKQINEIKRNCGYETGLLILMATKPEIREDYKTMIQSFNNYKALQRLLSSAESRIMTLQSIMRFQRENDGGG